MKKLKVAVIGVGGVGGYIGAKLAAIEDNNPEIFFVARGNHLAVIKEKGLTVNSADFVGGSININPILATDKISDLGEPDVLIITVKGYDLANISKELNNLVKKDTVILPLLNGADIYERMRRIIPGGIILPGCIYISSYIAAPGVINHTSKPGKVFIGKDLTRPEFIPETLLGLFERAKIDYVWKEDVNSDIWEKYIFIAGFSLVSACFNRTLGEILTDQVLKGKATGIMNEILRIATIKGIKLPDDIVDLTMKKASGYAYETKTSFQRDIEMKKPHNELEILGGTIIEMGEKLGVSTPFTDEVYYQLKES